MLIDINDIEKKIREVVKVGRVLINEPMAAHTTFKIGGPADVFVMPASMSELADVIKICTDSNVPYLVIGNGSNLLVRDGGIRGVVVSLMLMDGIAVINENFIRAESGALLSSVSKFARNNGLSGLEFAEGIPGSVGGGACMNAGAYEGEIGDVFASAEVVSANGDVRVVDLDFMDFSYRKSAIQKGTDIIASVTFALKRGDEAEISAKMADFQAQRTSKQPLELPSAGSAFKRPPGKFAGKLIMDCGLRGYQSGGAAVSEKHCGFIVNMGGATAADVEALILHVQKTVETKFGIWLEPEIRIIGDM